MTFHKKTTNSVVKNRWQAKSIVAALVVLIVAGVWLIWINHKAPNENVPAPNVPSRITNSFKTDFSRISINPDLLLSGGPGKDGIPALSNPKFEPIADSKIDNETLGLWLSIGGESRFYAYNILVWHEIVNDTVGGQPLAVTFCPLCGSAVVYSRDVGGKTLDFKVSGLLYESNMVMYDTDTESLWSQSTGKGIAGFYDEINLTILPFQLITKSEVATNHPGTLIMSTDTGYSRNYTLNPYGNYDDNEQLYFPVTVDDNRFKPKEVFYILPIDGDSSVAIRITQLQAGTRAEREIGGQKIVLEKTADGEVFARDSGGRTIPGYYEMWFSWATRHQDNGVVWDPSQ